MLRCQLYMFRTVTVHPQELLFRCCMCRPWYVVRNALSGTSRWYNVWRRTGLGVVLIFVTVLQSVLLHCVSRWNVYILQKMIHRPSNVKFNYTVFQISPSRSWMPFIQFVVHTLISWGFSCLPSWLKGQRFAVGHSCKCNVVPLYIMKLDMGEWRYSCTHSWSL